MKPGLAGTGVLWSMMTEKRVALLIANSQYEDEELGQLVAPAQDAEGLAGVLADTDIGGFEVETLLNEPSYRIRRSIEAFFDGRKRHDLLLLYISGHGIKDADGKLYFASTDTSRKLLRATAVSAGFVNEIMHRSRSRRQVLLLDCCYSGAFARGMFVRSGQTISTGEYFREGRGHVVLTASDALQYAFEGEQIKGEGSRSVFTQALVNGLATGEADLDQDGQISVDELYDYLYDRVTDQMPEQKPRKWIFDLEGEIVIARNPHPAVKPAELPPELRDSMADLRPWVREGAARQLGRLLQSDDEGLTLAAYAALTQMMDDDSQQVRRVVARILEGAPGAQPSGERERQPGPATVVKKEMEQTATGEMRKSRPAPFSSLPRLRLRWMGRLKAHGRSLTVTRTQLFLWLAWVAAGAVGWTVGWAAMEAGFRVGLRALLGGTFSWVVFGALFGAASGVMQWLVLRPHFDRAYRWFLATFAGVTFGWTVLEGASWTQFGALFGIGLGSAQWLVLRQRFDRAHWWILASAAGWAAGFSLAEAMPAPYELVPAGPVAAATTGLVLVWLLQASRSGAKDRE